MKEPSDEARAAAQAAFRKDWPYELSERVTPSIDAAVRAAFAVAGGLPSKHDHPDSRFCTACAADKFLPLTVNEHQREKDQKSLLQLAHSAIEAAQEVIGQCDCIMGDEGSDPKRAWYSARDAYRTKCFGALRRAGG